MATCWWSWLRPSAPATPRRHQPSAWPTSSPRSAGRCPGAARRRRSAAYATDWADFSTWCATIGLESLPATPGTVAGYVSELAFPPDDRAAAAISTITRRLAGIGQVHQLAGHANPCSDPLVRETMRGLRRALGVAPTQKKGITTGDVKAAVAALGDSPIDVRDRLILLLGFAGGMRRSELAGITVGDVQASPRGSWCAWCAPRPTRRRRGGASRSSTAPTPPPAPCAPIGRGLPPRGSRPARCCAGSTATAGSWDRSRPRGSPSSSSGTWDASAIPVSDFAGHSLRRGHATTAARNGASERTIMRTTGHTSTLTVRGYIEEGELFRDPASSYLGL